MIIKNLKKNIIKYISTASVICLIFSKPVMSLNYENYEEWLNQFFLNHFQENYSPKFIKEIIKESKLNKKEFYKIDSIINKIYDKDFKNPELYFNKKSILIRLRKAIKLSKTYKSQLSKIEKKFGVPQSIILSIWGIESDFGTVKLEFSALKAIVFHIYNGKRKKFYKDELNHILKIIKQDKINIKKILGSSYGAMGQPQFMPSNYIKYGYDFNNDEKVDLWNNESDTLASIANFLNSSGWEKNLTWGAEVTKNPDLPCYIEGPNNKKTIKD